MFIGRVQNWPYLCTPPSFIALHFEIDYNVANWCVCIGELPSSNFRVYKANMCTAIKQVYFEKQVLGWFLLISGGHTENPRLSLYKFYTSTNTCQSFFKNVLAVGRWLLPFLECNFDNNQFGSKTGRSTTHAVLARGCPVWI